MLEEKRKKRLREKEDDLADRQKEEEEIAEAKRRADEEREQLHLKDVLRSSSGQVTNGSEKTVLAEESNAQDMVVEQDNEGASGRENHIGNLVQNCFLNLTFCAFVSLSCQFRHHFVILKGVYICDR